MAQSGDHGGAAQPASVVSLPDSAMELVVLYYNVGFKLDEVETNVWKAKQNKLVADITLALDNHDPSIICLCDLGEMTIGIGSKLLKNDAKSRFLSDDEKVCIWLQQLLLHSAVSPVVVHSYGHYATIIRKDRGVTVEQYKIVDGFVDGQEERNFQFFSVRVDGDTEPISIINCHGT